MIFDKQTLFSDAQAITASAPSSNIIDLGATGTPFGSTIPLVRDIGKGHTIPLTVLVNEAFNNLTSLKVAVQVATDAAFTTPVETGSRTYLLSEITGELPFPASIPEGANLRYLRLYYTVAGTAPTTGKLTAGVVAARQTNF